MSAPDFDPIDLQIIKLLAAAMGQITQANGYYFDVAGAGIEPLQFGAGDQYPQIVVHEETSSISDNTVAGYQDEKVYALIGYIQAGRGNNAITNAHWLRDDIIARAAQLRPADFMGTVAGGVQRQLVRSINLVAGAREIAATDETKDFLQVIGARVSLDYRRFFPRPQGGL
jgi:hypothetical protein